MKSKEKAAPPRILMIEARYYEDISDMLADGAMKALKKARAEFERVEVPGALEIPAAVRMAAGTGRYDAYVALGCVLRGETSHYDIVSTESARGLTDLAIHYDLMIGNGILTCDTWEQAEERANPRRGNKGKDAAEAVLALLNLREELA